MKTYKYMAQRQGLFGLDIGYGNTIQEAMKKARISKTEIKDGFKDYGLFTVKDNGIVRIKANGRIC